MFSEFVILPFMASLAIGATVPAIALHNNPTDVLYRADFPQGNAQTVLGVVQFYSIDGTTKVHVDVTGLPKNSGMFSYHIHERPVGADKNCTSIGGHFNPYGAFGDCEDLGNDALCEIGDLSGKHGLINTTCFELFYVDPYLSLNPGSAQFIGGKSISIHLDNGEILACATIQASREPEDLLLLNAETEAEEVRKFEELAGIIHLPQQDILASAILPGQAKEAEPVEIIDSVEIEEDIEDRNTSEDVEQEEADVEEAETDNEDLDDLIFEDIEKHTNSTSGNDTNSTFIPTTNLTSADGDDEENDASSLSAGIIFSAITAGIVALLC
jgi:Cu/Zn superoxide dismutase